MVDDENIDPYASKDRNDSAKPETAPDAPSAEAELASEAIGGAVDLPSGALADVRAGMARVRS